MDWIDKAIELFGAITGLLYLYFSIKRIIWLWPLGLLTSATYIIVFFSAKFYADMGLNVYYLVISVYGWIFWAREKESSNDQKVFLYDRYQLLLALTAIVVIFGMLAFVLIHFTDSQIPYWDAFTTAGSIVATWMLARKILQHWIIWIVVDVVSAGLYLHKSLYFTFVLFVVYTIMAVVGFIQWRKQYKWQLSEPTPNQTET